MHATLSTCIFTLFTLSYLAAFCKYILSVSLWFWMYVTETYWFLHPTYKASNKVRVRVSRRNYFTPALRKRGAITTEAVVSTGPEHFPTVGCLKRTPSKRSTRHWGQERDRCHVWGKRGTITVYWENHDHAYFLYRYTVDSRESRLSPSWPCKRCDTTVLWLMGSGCTVREERIKKAWNDEVAGRLFILHPSSSIVGLHADSRLQPHFTLLHPIVQHTHRTCIRSRSNPISLDE